ncbi:MAG: lipopolysaccharide assembly protein LapA domain-containing protein [Luteimonas sp.]
MRPLRFLLALLSIAVGVAIGALNPQSVAVDLGIVVLHTTLGVVLLATLLLGALAGGTILVASVVLPLQRRLRLARQDAAARPVDGR